MSALPTPTLEERQANATFDALIWSLSRPGLSRSLPDEGETPIVDALIDRECNVFSADALLMPAILRTGAHIAELAEADHVFLGHMESSDPLQVIKQGSDLYPDDGATVIVRAKFGGGDRLRFSGPGVDGVEELSVSGLPHGFWQIRAQIMRYPMGFDLFLLDGSDIVGVPRSTIVEVL
ncbi:MAG: phosphonate C-P lyase system protein PhnH [Pseudomonadota bacterium]